MIEIKPFINNYVEDAVKIFTDNYGRLRRDHKELPGKYEKLDSIFSLLKGISDNPSAVAIKNGEVVGYMAGYANIKEFKGNNKGVYIPEWGHSSLGNDNKEDIYYRLYRYLSKEWISMENYTHCITYYANDDLLKELFFNLSFGLLVIDGLRPMVPIEIDRSKDILIRRAKLDDIMDIKRFDKGINAHLSREPIFLNRGKEPTIEELKNNFFNKDVITFVAERQGEMVSAIRAMVGKGPNAKTVQDKGTLGVNFGYTDPRTRGLDIATNVLAEVINWGIKNGMKHCTVDFESQNREGKRFWLRHFEPICHSVIRKVDDRSQI
ncbi:hypothetical protein [Dethiothermospora halolimnae]|uniref:hypothetical protein n=1 Tax=Dethiothermospora halolimnae TaxID=3114390 RepID=UPI003CCBCE01